MNKMSRLQGLVNEYRKECEKELDDLLRYYPQLMSNPEELIHAVAWAKTPEGKTHPHQWRISREAKAEAEKVLRERWNDIRSGKYKTFDDVMNLLTHIKGAGQLYAYDASLRLGSCFGIKPDKVYIHRGALDGAKNLLGPELVRGRSYLYMEELDSELQCLAPYHVENFLCIYKERLIEGEKKKSCYCAACLSRPDICRDL